MKIKLLNLFTVIFIVTFICGCFSEKNITAQNIVEEKIDPVEKILQSMTLEEKIGQIIMIGVYGTEMNDDVKFLLNQYKFGGVIFFDRNMDNREQVRNFSAELQSYANQKLPLFIALDEEGGVVARMKHDLTPPPAQSEIGMTGDFNLAKTTAQNISKELRNIGVNINFAPVADVGINNSRFFSDNGDIVANFVANAAEGYESENFFYCLKHFPGIGLSKIDPHQDISVIDANKNILDTVDLIPFKKIIAEHDNSKFMVMVGHLKYSALDSENPASLSYAIMKNLLRDELNFQGVVITDDLNMGAVSKYNDIETIGLQSFKAGADILLSCHVYEQQMQIYEKILACVKSGEISEERLNESVRRIIKMKLNLVS